MDALDVKLEAVFYETAVDTLVELVALGLTSGASPELLLQETTAMLLGNMHELPQMASLTAMAVMMLARERGVSNEHDPAGV